MSIVVRNLKQKRHVKLKKHVLELNIVNKNYVAEREFPNIIKITTPTKENQVAVYEFLRIDDAI